MVSELINVENLERTNRSFGGNAGAKRGIILNNEEYIIKYPKNIKEMKKQKFHIQQVLYLNILVHIFMKYLDFQFIKHY